MTMLRSPMYLSMIALVCLLMLSGSGFAQRSLGQGGESPTATSPTTGANLTLLTADANLSFVMQTFNEALGVECIYCHVAGDYASDANPKKEISRRMIAMTRQIETSFPSTTGVYPAGYREVDCLTCHRGQAKPATKAPREFVNRNEALGNAPPPPRPGVNLKVLTPGTQVHGGGVMHDFRDALNVDCAYCHGGGRSQEAEANPRKQTTRDMILLVRQINRHFPGTGVYPDGPQAVTCYTCHRGSPHPLSVSNRHYDPVK